MKMKMWHVIRWGGVRVALQGPSRSDPLSKTSKWVKERPGLAPGVEENLLVDHASREVTEGGSSNVFVRGSGGTWHTAGDGVLMGTVRGVTIDAIENVQAAWELSGILLFGFFLFLK